MPPNNILNDHSNYPISDHKMVGSSKLVVMLAIVVVMFIGTLIFAFWAYGGYKDNKNNVDKKIQAAVASAEQQLTIKKDQEFANELKNPNKTYQGPDTFGSISFKYPKTWSGFATIDDKASFPVDAYFHPGVVPGIDSGTAFALRVQVVNDTYSSVLDQLSNSVQDGSIKISSYRAPKVRSVLGSIVTGGVNQGQNDTMVVLPLRDKTIEISTQSDQYHSDFTSIIMASFKFSP